MKYLIETHGCQMNAHDSERMAGLLEQAGYEPASDDSDADVIVIDPAREGRIDGDLHLPVGWNPYTGMTVRGFPELVLSRGEVIIEGGQCLAKAGRGHYVRAEAGAPFVA